MTEDYTQEDVDIIDLFGASWEIYRRHAFAMSGAALIVLVLEALMTYFFVAGLILAGPMIMGLFIMALSAVRNEEVRLADAFRGFDYFVQAVFLSLAVLIISLVGFPLCVLPMLLVFTLFLTSFFFLIDGSPSLQTALRDTKEMLFANRRAWLLVGIYVLVLFAIGFATFGVGMLVTLPLGLISLAYAYDHARRGWPLSRTPDEQAEA